MKQNRMITLINICTRALHGSTGLCLCLLLTLNTVIAGGFPGILITDDGHQRAAIFNAEGELVWEHAFPKPYDAHLLPDNSLLVATGKGVERISPKGEVLMKYEVKGEFYSAIPLNSGNILALNCSEAEAIELTASGTLVRTIPLKGPKGHVNSRMIRKGGEHSFLVGHLGEHRAREYDFDGNVIAEFKAPGKVYEARRLSDGTTLLTYQQGIMQFDQQGKVVRSVAAKQFSKQGILWFSSIRELPNGNWLAGNWLGHGHRGQGVPFLEIDKNDNVVWSFQDNKKVLQATNITPLTASQLAAFEGSEVPSDDSHTLSCLGVPPLSALEAREVQGQDTLLFDFEDGGLDDDWERSESFPAPVVDRENQFHKEIAMKKSGRFFLSTLDHNGRAVDAPSGTIISPVIRLTQPTITMLVAGGAGPQTYVAICDNQGRELKKISGHNDQLFREETVTLPAMVGKDVFIKVVDDSSSGWGYILVDRIQMSGAINQEMAKERREMEQLSEQCVALLDSIGGRILYASSQSREFPKQYKEKLTEYYAKADAIAETLKNEPTFFETLKDFKAVAEAALHECAETLPKLLFVERKQYPRDHHNTGTIFQKGEINARSFDKMTGSSLKLLDVATGETKTLYTCPTGVIRDPEISFDNAKIVFSARKSADDDYHIYEMNRDGSDVRQLTSAAGVSDIDPFYLADGDIAFSSTREPKFCACNRHIMANLYRMKPDGANIEQIGKSIEFEGHGVQMPDGRLLYNRWEYIDRNFGGAQGLWTSNPDGTNHALYYGQATPHPILNARPIPGTNKVICILSSCHDRPWGALAILDRSKGSEGKEPILTTWPATARDQVLDESKNYGGGGGFDVFMKLPLKYEDPYALDSDNFLVSRMIKKSSEKTGLFWVDTAGHECLLHQSSSAGLGCYDPMPMMATERPSRLPEKRNHHDAMATCVISNVNIGTHMNQVEPGTIKYIRVVENPPKLFWSHNGYSGQGTQAPAMNNHDFDDKMILGTVPVEEDGSAHFEVPADRFIYLQVLDKDKKMVNSMRSGMTLQPGEVSSCVGCHEDRDQAPNASLQMTAQALKRAPSKLDGWFGAPRHFGFMEEVQPVLTKNCVSCHDYGKEAGAVLNLASDKDIIFNAAYQELHQKKYLTVIGGGANAIPDAYSWGSYSSPLIKHLESDQRCGGTLSADDLERIITWIDLNAPYYATHSSAYHEGLGGRSPLSGKQLARLTELGLLKKGGYNKSYSPHAISFDRPELSPILQGVKERDEAAYEEALEIIRAGQQTLREKPRADMPGFVPAVVDQNRKIKYDKLWKHQLKVRKAIDEGKKVYDSDMHP